jgi:hypothetical protein
MLEIEMLSPSELKAKYRTTDLDKIRRSEADEVKKRKTG